MERLRPAHGRLRLRLHGDGPAWGDDDGTGGVATPAPEPTPEPTATSSAAPTAPPGATPAAATPTPTPTPAPTAKPATGDIPYWAEDGRLNVLLIGGDAGPGRFSLRTDTMILLRWTWRRPAPPCSGSPATCYNVPLPSPYAATYKGGVFPDLLNALWKAGQNRSSWPGQRQDARLPGAVGNRREHHRRGRRRRASRWT